MFARLTNYILFNPFQLPDHPRPKEFNLIEFEMNQGDSQALQVELKAVPMKIILI